MEPKPSTTLREVAVQHLRAGDYDAAIRVCEQALQAAPDEVSWRFMLGGAHAACKNWEASSQAFQEVIDRDASLAEAHFNKANAERELGRIAKAIEGFRKAVELVPSANGWNNLGTALAQQGNLHEGVAAFRSAVELDATFESAQVNLIRGLAMNGDTAGAVTAAHEALENDNSSHRILAVLGEIWLNSNVINNAIPCFEAALQRAPEVPDLHVNMGMAYCTNGQLQQAEKHFRKAGQCGASGALVHANLGEIARKRRNLRAAMDHQRKSLQIDPDAPEVHSNLLLTMLYDEEISGHDLRREAGNWYAQHAAAVKPLPPAVPRKREVIRVGYVSGSLHQHPVGLFLEPVLAHHDPEKIAVHCYAHQEVIDDVTEQLRLSCDRWTDIKQLSDEQVAEQIRQDEIDVLIDLCGHSSPNRLRVFSYRPAPVQLTWMGYSSTTGSQDIDFVLGDRWVTPEVDAEYFSEQIVRMPQHYLCFAPPEEDIPTTRWSDDRPFTFGCLNNLAKMGPTVVEAWSSILHHAPAASLYLKSPSLTDAKVCQEVTELFAKRGIAADRIQLEGQGTREDFFHAYRRIDLALDPFPFHGGMTTMETLWMGVPIVTLVGERFVARVGESFLRAIGDEHLVTFSLDDYCRAAVEASKSIWTSAQRQQLRDRFLASPLCKCDDFTEQLEDLYQSLLADHT